MGQVLRAFVGSDVFSYTFVSDEFNGTTSGVDGVARPYIPRSFSSFSEMEEENGQSRMYLGIHWASDKTAGIIQGRKVADYVLANTYRRLTRESSVASRLAHQ